MRKNAVLNVFAFSPYFIWACAFISSLSGGHWIYRSEIKKWLALVPRRLPTTQSARAERLLAYQQPRALRRRRLCGHSWSSVAASSSCAANRSRASVACARRLRCVCCLPCCRLLLIHFAASFFPALATFWGPRATSSPSQAGLRAYAIGSVMAEQAPPKRLKVTLRLAPPAPPREHANGSEPMPVRLASPAPGSLDNSFVFGNEGDEEACIAFDPALLRSYLTPCIAESVLSQDAAAIAKGPPAPFCFRQ